MRCDGRGGTAADACSVSPVVDTMLVPLPGLTNASLYWGTPPGTDTRMRRYSIALACLLGTSILSTAASAAEAKHLDGPERARAVGDGLVGSVAPKLVVKTIDGEQIDLGSLYGKKAVYVKFWATWCKPCREQMPHLEHTYQNEGSDLAVIAVDIGFNDTLDDVKTLRQKLGLTMPIVFDDGRLGDAFHLRVTPQHVIIGRDGRVQYVGWLADQRLDDAIAAARKPVTSLAGGSTLKKEQHYGVGNRLPDLSTPMLDGTSFHLQDSRV